MNGSRRFIPRSDAELYAMETESLVGYVSDAKRAGEIDAARRATHMLLYKHYRRMRLRVATRLPEQLAHHADTVGDWVIERVMRSALRLPLKGSSAGEWVNWWKTAVDRQVISYWRTSEGQSLAKQVQLPAEHESEEEHGPDRIADDFNVDRLSSRRATGKSST